MTYTQPDGTGRCVGKHRHEPERPRSAAPGSHLCGGCIARLDVTLKSVPALVDDLERALLNRVSGQGAKVSGSPTRPLPYNDDASSARLALLDVLASWTKLMAEERNERLPSDLSPRGQAEWQHNRLTVWTIAQEWIDEYASNLHDVVGEGRRVLAGARTRTLTLGDCPNHDRCDVDTRAEQACTGELRARIDLIDELLPAAVACTSCGQEHAARDLPALGKRMTGGHAWLTTAEAAKVLELTQEGARQRALKEGWRLRDGARVRPSRWHLDDVLESQKKADEKAVV